jgi:1-aminocyclopropane-1-carboxylate deaminase
MLVEVDNTIPMSAPLHKLSPYLSAFMLDAVHEGLGNKFYKLKLNLQQVKHAGLKTIVTFGGAWSNHIYATAMVGRQEGLQTVGIVRGERPDQLSATLQDAIGWGMHLEFVSRSDYRRQGSVLLMQSLREEYGEFYLLPEGGSNRLAVRGCSRIINDLDDQQDDYDLLVLPVGTGGTLAGVVMGLGGRAEVLGISVLKGGEFLNDEVRAYLVNEGCLERNWSINQDFHCGGYARCPGYLRSFILEFEDEHQIPLDPVYTGKMMSAIGRLRDKGMIAGNTKVVAVHTGGLQGRRGFKF